MADYNAARNFFEQAGYKMQEPQQERGYINSVQKEGMQFVLYPDDTEFKFCWQVKRGETTLDDVLPNIQKTYPQAATKQGTKNDEWTRLFIPLNQSDPSQDALNIVKQTSFLVMETHQ
jgi:hypothetical protein